METYHIRVCQHLDHDWSEWLGGGAMAHRADGSTQIIAHVVDQAALFGLLVRLRDIGCTLTYLRRTDKEDKTDETHFERT